MRNIQLLNKHIKVGTVFKSVHMVDPLEEGEQYYERYYRITAITKPRQCLRDIGYKISLDTYSSWQDYKSNNSVAWYHEVGYSKLSGALIIGTSHLGFYLVSTPIEPFTDKEMEEIFV